MEYIWVLADRNFPILLRSETSYGTRMETRELRLNVPVSDLQFKKPAALTPLVPFSMPDGDFEVEVRRIDCRVGGSNMKVTWQRLSVMVAAISLVWCAGNAPALVDFVPASGKAYLMFLKVGKDDVSLSVPRYEPVVGQTDPALCIQPLDNEVKRRMVKATPRETDELLANPGMGWQTFHTFADEDKNLQGLPSASAYFRFYWREIERKEGAIDFAKFDELLAHARRAGQKLAFRIMCTGSGEYMDVPDYLKEQGCKGVEFLYGGQKHWVPDYEDPLFQKAHFRLIRELGKRYDGHSDLDLIDIGSVGLWGEWHMSDTKVLDTGTGVPLPSVETRLKIIEAWRKAFPKTSKVMLIGSDEGMTRAVQMRYGWRADCLGDMGGFSKTWNHMEHYYMQQLEKTGAQEAWKAAPVAFESCWDMRKWKQEGWDIHFIYDYALRCHASYMNNKSAPLPEGTRAEVERFLRRLGYRLVVRRVEHLESVTSGESADVEIAWENVGVAPPYRDYRVAIRLTNIDGKAAKPIIAVSDASIRGWLPGTQTTKAAVRIPKAARPGRYELSVGLVDPATKSPAVRLAIEGRDAEGWYPVSHLDIRR